MSDTNPPIPPAGAPGPAPADAAAKKQTVRISLPSKPSGGPSIKIPTSVAPAAPASGAAKVTQVISAPPPPGAARPAVSSAPPPPRAAAAAPPRPAHHAVSGVDVGLAIGTVIAGTLAALRLAFL
ncbi:MAG: hypothetical protein EXS36_04410 [Pedosphaera sp.]|nr:hypothetical protein [Pedosphaera sp.]